MSEETMHQLLLEFKYRQPFEPFVVALTNGKQIFVDEPAVLFNGPAAGYVGKDNLIAFSCDEIQSISPAVAEAKP